jgi:hypothetical protein
LMNHEAVAEVLADEAPGHLVQEQPARSDVTLLAWVGAGTMKRSQI